MNLLALFADIPPTVAGDHQTDWYTPVAAIVRSLLWICLISWALKKFGDEIKKLIARVASVKFPGGGADFKQDDLIADQRKGQALSGNAEIEKAYEKEKLALPLTRFQQEIYEKIMGDVRKSQYTKDQIIDVGVMGMARVASEADFWRIYALIFGSQLVLLHQANSGPIKEVEIIYHWIMLEERLPALTQNVQREAYLHFLTGNLLLKHENKQYEITDKGREFLVWLTKNGLSSNKGFQ
jgi:hypothetical protein